MVNTEYYELHLIRHFTKEYLLTILVLWRWYQKKVGNTLFTSTKIFCYLFNKIWKKFFNKVFYCSNSKYAEYFCNIFRCEKNKRIWREKWFNSRPECRVSIFMSHLLNLEINSWERNVSNHLGVRIWISRNMAMASPETEITLACFITWEWNASTGSSPANSEDGMWNRISVKLTGASSFWKHNYRLQHTTHNLRNTFHTIWTYFVKLDGNFIFTGGTLRHIIQRYFECGYIVYFEAQNRTNEFCCSPVPTSNTQFFFQKI